MLQKNGIIPFLPSWVNFTVKGKIPISTIKGRAERRGKKGIAEI